MLENAKLAAHFQHAVMFGFVLSLVYAFTASSLVHAASAQAATSPVSTTQLSQSFKQLARQQAVEAFSYDQHTRAYRLLMPLAAANDVISQYYLASLYDAGLGVERNAAEAAYWYRRAALNGHTDAQYNLGVAYSKGDGVQRDMSDAARWWRAAARKGSLNAQFNLGLVYMHGKGVTADASEAVRWWEMAASQGDPVSQYNLGTLYANGEGVEQNIGLARSWWQRAAAQGFEQAIDALSQLENIE